MDLLYSFVYKVHYTYIVRSLSFRRLILFWPINLGIYNVKDVHIILFLVRIKVSVRRANKDRISYKLENFLLDVIEYYSDLENAFLKLFWKRVFMLLKKCSTLVFVGDYFFLS